MKDKTRYFVHDSKGKFYIYNTEKLWWSVDKTWYYALDETNQLIRVTRKNFHHKVSGILVGTALNSIVNLREVLKPELPFV